MKLRTLKRGVYVSIRDNKSAIENFTVYGIAVKELTAILKQAVEVAAGEKAKSKSGAKS